LVWNQQKKEKETGVAEPLPNGLFFITGWAHKTVKGNEVPGAHDLDPETL